MELKKQNFPGQLPLHAFLPRKRFSGCCGLCVAATLFMVGVALLNFSFKAPFFNPVFQGLNGFGYKNATFCCKNEENAGNFSSEEDGGGFEFGEEGLWVKTHELNLSGIDKNVKFTNFTEEKGKNEENAGRFSGEEDGGGFDFGEEGLWVKTHKLKLSGIDKNVNFTNFTEEKGKNRSFSLEGQPEKGGAGDQSKGVAINKKESSLSVKTNVIGKNGSELLRKGRSFYSGCDIFDGEWVRDETKPFYPPGSCPYIDRDFDCRLNKRPDDAYVKWRWQPYACDIPRFNAIDFLERLRGQKLVFVGDSLNRNMWESFVCILRHHIRDKKRVFEISGRSDFKKKGFYAFRFEDYNCSVDFVSSPFLVRESSFKGMNGSFETLRLDLMDKTTSMYNDADIIIFNTGHWWTHEKTSRGEDYYQEGNRVHPRLEVLEAYKRALYTWARWVDKNIDANRTQVIFRGYSVTHFRGGPWNSGGQCHNETEPFYNEKHLEKYPPKMKVLEHVLRDMRTPVAYMNISRLTDFRKDGHPSIYRVDTKTSLQAQDCSHWCLPGVPDTWNELLYASLLKTRRGSWQSPILQL